MRKGSQEARKNQDWDWNSLRLGSKAENPCENLDEAAASIPANAQQSPIGWNSCYKL